MQSHLKRGVSKIEVLIYVVIMVVVVIIFRDIMTPSKSEPTRADPLEEVADVSSGTMDKVLEGSQVFPGFQVDCEYLARQNAKFVSVEVEADLSALTPGDLQALPHLIRAADDMDEIFWDQSDRSGDISHHSLKMASLENGGLSDCDDNLKRWIGVNYGRFDRTEENKCFLGGHTKPAGAGFYSEGLDKVDFAAMVKAQKNAALKAALKSPYTLVDVEPCLSDGENVSSEPVSCPIAIPYSEAYESVLTSTADSLRRAARTVSSESLAVFLNGRAKNFLDNNYPESDALWVDVEGSGLEITIGPYEVYEDGRMSWKAAYEAFVTAVNGPKTKKLEEIKIYLEEMEAALPLNDKYRGYKRVTTSPIFAVDLIYSAGDTRAAQQTLAFNLPNDENVREVKGSKKVMMINIADIKFKKMLYPIAEVIVGSLIYVTSASFLWHIVLHELAHGMGPGKIVMPNGEQTTVSQALRELYPSIEEAKADLMALWMALYLENKGFDAVGTFQEALTTQLASAFRSMRFGRGQAHGNANNIIYSCMMEQGVWVWDYEMKVFFVDMSDAEEAVTGLLRKILEIEATGDYDGAKELLDIYTNPDSLNPLQSREVNEALELIDFIMIMIEDVPVDFKPVYKTADEIMATDSAIEKMPRRHELGLEAM